jgi:hypothetical protein
MMAKTAKKKIVSVDFKTLREAAATAAGAKQVNPEFLDISPKDQRAFDTLNQASEELSETIDLLARAGWLSVSMSLTGMRGWVTEQIKEAQPLIKSNKKKFPKTKHVHVYVDAKEAYTNGGLVISLPSARNLDTSMVSTSEHEDQ